MKKINTAVVGLRFGVAGIIEGEFVNGGAGEFFEIKAVCDINTERCDEIAKKYNVKAYYDMDSLLKDGEIDVIILATGPVGRAGQISQIIRSGKDVMTTKPFEIDHKKGLEVLKEAKSLGRIVHLNSPAPVHYGSLKQIFDWVERYDLGRPIACRADTWAAYRENPTGNWYDDPEQCPAAPIYRLGIYLINDLYPIFGEADQVTLLQSRVFTGRPTSDNAQLGILFKNGAIANVFASFCVKDGQPYKCSLVLNYENGTISRNVVPYEKPKTSRDFLELVMAGDNGTNIIHKKETLICNGDYRWDILYKSIKGENCGELTPPEAITHGIQIIEAMIKAQRSGRTETV